MRQVAGSEGHLVEVEGSGVVDVGISTGSVVNGSGGGVLVLGEVGDVALVGNDVDSHRVVGVGGDAVPVHEVVTVVGVGDQGVVEAVVADTTVLDSTHDIVVRGTVDHILVVGKAGGDGGVVKHLDADLGLAHAVAPTGEVEAGVGGGAEVHAVAVVDSGGSDNLGDTHAFHRLGIGQAGSDGELVEAEDGGHSTVADRRDHQGVVGTDGFAGGVGPVVEHKAEARSGNKSHIGEVFHLERSGDAHTVSFHHTTLVVVHIGSDGMDGGVEGGGNGSGHADLIGDSVSRLVGAPADEGVALGGFGGKGSDSTIGVFAATSHGAESLIVGNNGQGHSVEGEDSRVFGVGLESEGVLGVVVGTGNHVLAIVPVDEVVVIVSVGSGVDGNLGAIVEDVVVGFLTVDGDGHLTTFSNVGLDSQLEGNELELGAEGVGVVRTIDGGAELDGGISCKAVDVVAEHPSHEAVVILRSCVECNDSVLVVATGSGRIVVVGTSAGNKATGGVEVREVVGEDGDVPLATLDEVGGDALRLDGSDVVGQLSSVVDVAGAINPAGEAVTRLSLLGQGDGITVAGHEDIAGVNRHVVVLHSTLGLVVVEDDVVVDAVEHSGQVAVADHLDGALGILHAVAPVHEADTGVGDSLDVNLGAVVNNNHVGVLIVNLHSTHILAGGESHGVLVDSKVGHHDGILRDVELARALGVAVGPALEVVVSGGGSGNESDDVIVETEVGSGRSGTQLGLVHTHQHVEGILREVGGEDGVDGSHGVEGEVGGDFLTSGIGPVDEVVAIVGSGVHVHGAAQGLGTEALNHAALGGIGGGDIGHRVDGEEGIQRAVGLGSHGVDGVGGDHIVEGHVGAPTGEVVVVVGSGVDGNHGDAGAIHHGAVGTVGVVVHAFNHAVHHIRHAMVGGIVADSERVVVQGEVCREAGVAADGDGLAVVGAHGLLAVGTSPVHQFVVLVGLLGGNLHLCAVEDNGLEVGNLATDGVLANHHIHIAHLGIGVGNGDSAADDGVDLHIFHPLYFGVAEGNILVVEAECHIRHTCRQQGADSSTTVCIYSQRIPFDTGCVEGLGSAVTPVHVDIRMAAIGEGELGGVVGTDNLRRDDSTVDIAIETAVVLMGREVDTLAIIVTDFVGQLVAFVDVLLPAVAVEAGGLEVLGVGQGDGAAAERAHAVLDGPAAVALGDKAEGLHLVVVEGEGVEVLHGGDEAHHGVDARHLGGIGESPRGVVAVVAGHGHLDGLAAGRPVAEGHAFGAAGSAGVGGKGDAGGVGIGNNGLRTLAAQLRGKQHMAPLAVALLATVGADIEVVVLVAQQAAEGHIQAGNVGGGGGKHLVAHHAVAIGILPSGLAVAGRPAEGGTVGGHIAGNNMSGLQASTGALVAELHLGQEVTLSFACHSTSCLCRGATIGSDTASSRRNTIE